MSLRVTISWAVKRPAEVAKDFRSANSFGIAPFGITDLLIKILFVPESNRTRSSFLLRNVPMVFAVQILTGVCPTRRRAYIQPDGGGDWFENNHGQVTKGNTSDFTCKRELFTRIIAKLSLFNKNGDTRAPCWIIVGTPAQLQLSNLES